MLLQIQVEYNEHLNKKEKETMKQKDNTRSFSSLTAAPSMIPIHMS